MGATASFSQRKMPYACRKPRGQEQKDWALRRRCCRALHHHPRAWRRHALYPRHIQVREGETVRLRAQNKGKVMHEIVIGTKAELTSTQGCDGKHPGMERRCTWPTSNPASAATSCGINRAGHFDGSPDRGPLPGGHDRHHHRARCPEQSPGEILMQTLSTPPHTPSSPQPAANG